MKDLKIKELREKLGLTQEKLAELIGVSRNTIINYEKGGKIPDSKRQILNNILNHNTQNTTSVNEPAAVYLTGYDKKIDEARREIEKVKLEIVDLEKKLKDKPNNKEEYEKYIASKEKQIYLLDEIINSILVAKKDHLDSLNE